MASGSPVGFEEGQFKPPVEVQGSEAMGGGESSRWLMAASYDRLLNRLKEPQRFGTQYLSQNGEPVSLGEVRPGVTDSMRAALHVPTLAEAKAREAAMRAMTTSAK